MANNERRCMPSGASMCELVRSWRLPEFVCLLVVWKMGTVALSLASLYGQYIPPNDADGVNGYPVRLDSVWCLAEDLSSCSTSSDRGCCLMMENGVQPGETVTSPMLTFVFFGVPLIFIVLRQISIRCGVYRSPGSFADLFLGLLFCLAMCFLLTDTIKTYVARPRPNYFALQALIEYGGSDVYSVGETSVKSFPSGHSSESMAGTSFVTLVCWADLLHCPSCFTGWKRSLLAYLAVLPALISIWVGITRIRDYWHFQDDVLAGWTIGAISAAVAVRWVIYPETFWRRSTMQNGRLEEKMEINMLPDGQNNAFALIDPTYGSAGYSPHDEGHNPIASV